MSLPAGLEKYQAVLAGGHRSGTRKDNDGKSEAITKTEDGGTLFNSKFEDVKEIWHDGELLTVTKTQSQYKRTQQSKKRFGEYSLLLRRILDLNDRKKPKLQLEIQSDTLRREFRRLAQGMSSISLNHDPIVIPEPYSELYYCRERIRKAVAEAATEETRRELQLLVDFETQFMSPTIATIKSFESTSTIEFDWLWSLFAPGCDVVIRNTSATTTAVEWCAVLKSYQTEVDNGVASWIVTVTHTGFNGQKFGNVQTAFKFPSFPGTVDITQLPAYPLHYHRQKKELTKSSIARGEKFEQYCLKSSKTSRPPIGITMTYEGPFWTLRDEYEYSRRGCRMHDSPSTTINGRVVVDVEGFLSSYPIFRETLLPEQNAGAGDDGSDNDSDSDSIEIRRRIMRLHYRDRMATSGSIDGFAPQLPKKPLSAEQRLTCPPFVPAFSFSTRKWGLVLVDELEDVKWDSDVYDKLQIDDSIKTTLHSIIDAHSTRSTDFDDFIKGKGLGLVVLLHGPPGCGKTMTAESIAESLEKPLYNVNGGELGTSAASIQSGLEKAFGLVSRWDAIFLLDEADAFLARRGDSVEKNAPISVFLRLLEYQAGIIFLTTNRVVNIDEAFHSRIHIDIPYSKLDNAKRAAIWKDLAREKCSSLLADGEASALGNLPVDGRTIKNVLRLASLLTKSRGDEADMCFSDIIAVLPLALRDTESDLLSEQRSQSEEERIKREELSAAMSHLMSEFSSGIGPVS